MHPPPKRYTIKQPSNMTCGPNKRLLCVHFNVHIKAYSWFSPRTPRHNIQWKNCTFLLSSLSSPKATNSKTRSIFPSLFLPTALQHVRVFHHLGTRLSHGVIVVWAFFTCRDFNVTPALESQLYRALTLETPSVIVKRGKHQGLRAFVKSVYY